MEKTKNSIQSPNTESSSPQSNDILSSNPGFEDIPDEIADVLNELPEDHRKQVTQIMAASFGMVSRHSPEGDVAKKITSEHITTMLKTQEKGMEYTFKENRNRMVFYTVILLVVVGTVLGIIALLKDNNSETMEKILTVFISGALGAAGGYGIGIKKSKDD